MDLVLLLYDRTIGQPCYILPFLYPWSSSILLLMLPLRRIWTSSMGFLQSSLYSSSIYCLLSALVSATQKYIEHVTCFFISSLSCLISQSWNSSHLCCYSPFCSTSYSFPHLLSTQCCRSSSRPISLIRVLSHMTHLSIHPLMRASVHSWFAHDSTPYLVFSRNRLQTQH